MKIYIGSDHAGYEHKEELKIYLSSIGCVVDDKGDFAPNHDDDYPDFVKLVAEAVARNEGSFGIIIGGTGQGEAMCANKIAGVRAALFYGPIAAKSAVDISGRESTDLYEIVKLARLHNDANILSLSARFLSIEESIQAVKVFLETPFSNEERHTRRIAKF